MGLKGNILSWGRRAGAWRLLGRAYGSDRLTVLAYHRVIDHTAPEFTGFVGNVSASPAEFARQMEWVADRFHPVSLSDVAAFAGGGALPKHPLLVTFDDGYYDNLEHALPVLRRLGIPATIFLATDHIGTTKPFWWDLAAWALETVGADRVDLPILGPTEWNEVTLRALQRRWIEAAKRRPDTEKHEMVAELLDVLGVVPGGGEPDAGTMSWSDVTAADPLLEFGAHTRTHPILTRVPAEVAHDEVRTSVSDVAAATGSPVLGFAYPNGGADDFDRVARRAVAEAGVPLAFTLEPGPARRREVMRDPLGIRRVYVHHGDGIDRFAAKVAGAPRLIGALR